MSNNSVLSNTVSNIDTSPVGLIDYFAGTSAPGGYLVCDGTAISRSTYSELFSVINTIYGDGDGVATFNLPDLRGEFIRGVDLGSGADANRSLGSKQKASLVANGLNTADGRLFTNLFDSENGKHFDAVQTDPSVGYNFAYSATAQNLSAAKLGSFSDGQYSKAVRPRNIALLPCIKFRMCSYYYTSSKTMLASYISNPSANEGDNLIDQSNSNTYTRINNTWVRTSTPAGIMTYNYSNTIPSGWLKVNPLVVYSQANYPELATALSIANGGTWSFVDTRGEFIRVWDDSRGVDSGRVIRSTQGDLVNNSSITRTFAYEAQGVDGNSWLPVVRNTSIAYNIFTFGNGGIETRPRNIAFPLLIKV